MGVIYGFAAPWASDGGTGVRQIDIDTATLFLRAQASWLRQGLERSADPAAVGIVLGSHDASHESWLALIGLVERLDADVAEALSTLYGYHGRVVGSLERGFDTRLDADVLCEVRRMLSDRLEQLTDEAAARLAALRFPVSPDATSDATGAPATV